MKKKIGICFLVALTAFGTVSFDWNIVSAQTEDEIKKEIKDLEKEQLQLGEEKEDIQNNKSETEEKIEENLNEQASVQSQIDSLDQKLNDTKATITAKQGEIDATNKEIEELTSKIEDLKNEIKQLKEEIEVLLERIAEREELLSERLRTIQRSGGAMRYLEVLLGSKSFSDFISRTAAVNIMMDQDKAILESLANDKKEVENKKSTVESNKKDVESKRQEVEDNKVALEGQKNELVALEKQLDEQMAERQILLAKLEEEHHHLEQYVITLEDEQRFLAQQEEAAKKAQQIAEQQLAALAQKNESSNSNNNASSPNAGTGKFIWPASGSRTSNFGWRVHPIYFTKNYHGGVDIGAPKGTPIYSSGAGVGVVSTAEYHSSYGNHVMVVNIIDGQTYVTNYAHMSSIAVSPGQQVEQGQVIGYVGSTGDSTGPHLHFEIHLNRYVGVNPNTTNAVNPVNYLP
ncbi:murein hydrolase activator EnvC family protein [Paucisalibacillus globulus]|uniref:murein hydrolase activator EnvC family protein n=1 Tax=Paucisalibacillus globulus TaxID=351095 RepID=UPI00040F315E|nr:peptidoglycan DD-metalloendopeptidase family protein [Paucisalibacillus globulus]